MTSVLIYLLMVAYKVQFLMFVIGGALTLAGLLALFDRLNEGASIKVPCRLYVVAAAAFFVATILPSKTEAYIGITYLAGKEGLEVFSNSEVGKMAEEYFRLQLDELRKEVEPAK